MENILNDTVKKINGPVNIVRLQGSINGIDKVIYLLMDFHIFVGQQTECNNVFAKDIQTFLADNFKNLNDSNIMYDFFMEIRPTVLGEIRHVYDSQVRMRYIEEVFKFFRKIFNYNPSENKVSVSKSFKNIRLHYVDIREFFSIYINKNITVITNIIQNMWSNQYINLSFLAELKNTVQAIIVELKELLVLFENPVTTKSKSKSASKSASKSKSKSATKSATKSKSKSATKSASRAVSKSASKSKSHPLPSVNAITSPGFLTGNEKMTAEQQKEIQFGNLKRYINKLYTSYKHPDIKNKIQQYFETIKNNLRTLIKDCENNIDYINFVGDDIYSKHGKLVIYTGDVFYDIDPSQERIYITTIYNSMEKFSSDYIIYFSIIMDLFFLRRFLDKDYITHAIVYSGAAHSSFYIEELIKKFKFQITHVSYSKYPLNQANKIIKNSKNDTFMGQQIFYPEPLIQCSNMTGFPNNFL